MKAAVYYTNGGPDVFNYQEVPLPKCDESGVLIKVVAISVEGGDLIARELGPVVEVPHVVGYQCAGTIIEIGSRVKNLKVGQAVVAISPSGSHAEFVAAPAAQTWLVPDGLDLDVAAAVPVAWGTANECLFAFGNLKAGESVLIHAGAGALGLAAIQLAKRAGARVFTTASSEVRLDRLRKFGADVAINYVTEDFVEVIRSETDGQGVDLVIDSIAGETLAQSISALKYRGRAITVGVSGRNFDGLNPVSLWANCNSLQGVYFPSSLPNEHNRAYGAVQSILADVAQGNLEVVIDRIFPLAEEAFGRVLLRP
jgi:NADPH2:quinone reductase